MNRESNIFLKAVASLVATVCLFAQPALADEVKQEPVYSTNELRIDPARAEEFHAFMKEAAVDTRAFDGNQYFAILVDEMDPGRVIFYQIWESKAHHAAYRAWRNETGFGALFFDFLVGGPTEGMESHYYTKLSD